MLHRVRRASALTGAWRRPTAALLSQAQRFNSSNTTSTNSQCSNVSSPPSSPSARQYISLYHYTPLQATELPRLRRRMLAVWRRMDVLGRIYISQEGVNAQLTLPQTRVAAFTTSFPELFSRNHMFFGALIQQKNPNVHGTSSEKRQVAVERIAEPFEKLNVRIRDQIVRDGFAKGHLDLQDSGNSLPPNEWHEKLRERNASNDDQTLVLDVRNFYEHDIGRFDGATRIMVDTFRDTFDAVDEILDQHAQAHGGENPREVMMYCTGGIRCEKVGAYLAQYKGIANVQKLHGGIVNYMNFLRESEDKEESLFKGKNFVFDQRCVANDPDATAEEEVTPDVLGECFQCGEPCNQHANCANLMCGGLILQCRNCATKFSGACSDACKQEVLRMNQLTPEALREYRKLHADKWKPQIPNALPKFSKHLRIRPIPPSMQAAAQRSFCTSASPSRHVGPLSSSSKATDSERDLGTLDADSERAQLNRYVNAKSSAHQDEELLIELREATQREFPKAIQLIDEPQGKFLRFLVETIRAKRVLEIGCFTGYSALCMANGLAQDDEDGKLITCDIDAHTMAFAQRYFARSSRSSQIQSVLKDGLEFLDQLALDEEAQEPFDLVFVDANKKQYAAYYETILEKKLLSTNGLLVFDNTLFRGRVLACENGVANSKERIAQALAKFNAHVAADPRTSQVLLPLWDGLTIVRQV